MKTLPPKPELLTAMLNSDAAYEGVFYTAVHTTGIFCRPTCPARKPKPENVSFFATAEACLAAGFRPCKRCQPLRLPDALPAGYAELFARTDADPRRGPSDAQLLEQGIDPVALRRWCHKRYGLTFQALVRARKMAQALGRLQEGQNIDDVASAAGYASLSAFRDAFAQATGVPPGQAAQLNPLWYRHVDSPLGPLMLMASAQGLVMCEFLDRPILVAELDELRQRHGFTPLPGEHPHLTQAAQELSEYFAGTRKAFAVPLHTPGSAFQQRVWQALQAIPYGETRSYGVLAQAIASPGAARAVGLANGQNRMSIIIPCHRVIGANGKLVGYGGGQARKQWLLQHEGVALAKSDAVEQGGLFAG